MSSSVRTEFVCQLVNAACACWGRGRAGGY